jgi:hypothetical protein
LLQAASFWASRVWEADFISGETCEQKNGVHVPQIFDRLGCYFNLGQAGG